MRVAYLVSMRRGLPVFTYREIKLLRDRAVDVHLYVMRDGKGVAMPEPEWPVIQIHIIPALFRHLSLLVRTPHRYLSALVEAFRENTLLHFAAAGCFVHEFQASDIDVIYCNEGNHALWIAYFARRWFRRPIVVIVHNHMVTARHHLSITQRAADLSSRIITISDYNKTRLMERYDLPKEKIEVIRLWSPHQPDKRIRVMIVGMWTERKGHDVLLDAFESLDPQDYVLWVVGSGVWKGEFYDVEAEAKQRGIEDRVVFWGHLSQEKLKVLYQSCDIFVLPSRTTEKGTKEGIPVSLMEAMSFGCPVISTYHAGIPELVQDILIEENNAEQLREAIETLGRDPELRRQLGQRNREIVEERYSERNVDGILDVLTQAHEDSSREGLNE